MNSELIINSTKDGKVKQQTIRNINPDIANSVAGAFAEKCVAMSTENYSSANVVRKSDVTETVSGGATNKQTPVLSLSNWVRNDNSYSASITYNGDGGILTSDIGRINGGIITLADINGTFDGVISAREGANFAPARLAFSHTREIVELADYSDGYDAGYAEGYTEGYDEGGGGVTGLLDPNFTVDYDNGTETGTIDDDDETTTISVYNTADCTLTCTWEGAGTFDYILFDAGYADASVTYNGNGEFIISNPRGVLGAFPTLICLLYSDGEYAASFFDLRDRIVG